MEVNKQHMLLWVEALRSGEFQQGSSALARLGDDGQLRYCCLGVACEVAIRSGLNVDRGERPKCELSGCVCDREDVVAFDGERGFLPEAVHSWYGLREDHNPPVGPGTLATVANDDLSWTFEVIAASIESYYKLKDADE